MAGGSDILKEYLLALKFTVDSRSTRTLDTTVKTLDKGASALAKSLLGVTAAAQAMVIQYAKSMEQMYYSARRAETTVGNLKALQYGYRQIGLDAGQAASAVEGIARATRMNPGLVGLLKELGVPTQGKTKDEVLIGLVEALRKMPFYQAARYAELFGIDPDQLYMLEEGIDKLKESMAVRKKWADEAGVDTEKASEAAKEYAQSLNEIREKAMILKDALAMALLPAFREVSRAISETLTNTTQWLNFAQRSTPGEFFSEFKKRFIQGWNEKFGNVIQMGPGGSAPAPSAVAASAAMTPVVTPKALPLGMRNMNPGNLRAGEGQTGTSGGFATFGSNQQGLSALARQLLLYDSRGINTIKKIISTYAPSSENNTDAYIAAVSKSTGYDANAQLALSDPGTLATLMKAIVRHEQGYQPFATAAYETAAVNRLGGVPQIQQENNFYIQSTDPRAAGREVGDAQKATNADLMRNIGAGKVR